MSYKTLFIKSGSIDIYPAIDTFNYFTVYRGSKKGNHLESFYLPLNLYQEILNLKTYTAVLRFAKKHHKSLSFILTSSSDDETSCPPQSDLSKEGEGDTSQTSSFAPAKSVEEEVFFIDTQTTGLGTNHDVPNHSATGDAIKTCRLYKAKSWKSNTSSGVA